MYTSEELNQKAHVITEEILKIINVRSAIENKKRRLSYGVSDNEKGLYTSQCKALDKLQNALTQFQLALNDLKYIPELQDSLTEVLVATNNLLRNPRTSEDINNYKKLAKKFKNHPLPAAQLFAGLIATIAVALAGIALATIFMGAGFVGAAALAGNIGLAGGSLYMFFNKDARDFRKTNRDIDDFRSSMMNLTNSLDLDESPNSLEFSDKTL